MAAAIENKASVPAAEIKASVPTCTASVPAAAASASVPTCTVAEAARSRYTSGGVQFIKADLLGTIPINRSGLGCSGYHVHEIVTSIQADGLSRRRYRDASVVRVPDKHLDSFRQFNKAMCDGDDLLPAFAPGMKYAVLTKNHFVHAVKLFDAASAFLHGTKELIRPNPKDPQLVSHLAEGIACEVFKEELWLEDPEGMAAIVGEDNWDAATNLAASEMEVVQTLRQLLSKTSSDSSREERFGQVIAQAVSRFGNMAWSSADYANLFSFVCRVPAPLVENLCQVHFAAVPAALLRLRPADFGLVAKLSSSEPYLKVALIISFYLGAIASAGALRRQPGGVTAFAAGLKKDVFDKIEKDSVLRETAEKFLREMLRHYAVDMTTALAKNVLHCRARLFFRIGKLAQNWPASSHAVESALAKVEEKYAQELLQSNAFVKPPQPLNREPVLAQTAGTAQASAAAKSASKKRPRPADTEFDFFGEEGLGGEGETASTAKASCPAPLALAYDLDPTGFRSLEAPAWGSRRELLWLRLAQQGLLQMHIQQKASADMVEVSVLEASEPVVYQARALQDVSLGQLILVPFVEPEPALLEDTAKWRRPKTLHPHLPFVAGLRAGAPSVDDTTRFMLKSPLASATLPVVAPAPFWATLAAQKDADANMKSSTMNIEFAPTEITIAGEKALAKGRGKGKKKGKAPPLRVDIPVLVNRKDIQRGEVLVFQGSADEVGDLSEDTS